jgi:hypothetical protein
MVGPVMLLSEVEIDVLHRGSSLNGSFSIEKVRKTGKGLPWSVSVAGFDDGRFLNVVHVDDFIW